MKRSVLNAAIVGALGLSVGGVAVAQQSLNVAGDELEYAQQIPDGSVIDMPPPAEEIEFDLGFGISDGDERFIRLDLTNGAFDGAFVDTTAPTSPSSTEFHINCITTGGTVDTSVCDFALGSGGTDGSSFVVVGLSANGANLPPTQTIRLTIPDLETVTTSGTIDLRYRLYEDPVDANASGGGPNTLADVTDEIVSFVNGISTTGSDSGTCTIDVTAGSVRLVGEGFPEVEGFQADNMFDTCACGGPQSGTSPGPAFSVTATPSVFWSDGDFAEVADILADTAITVQTTPNTFDYADGSTVGVYTSTDSSCGFAGTTGVIDMDGDTAVLDTASSFFSTYVCLENTTGEEFEVSSVSASIDFTAATGAEDTESVSFPEICDFDKNGSEDNLLFSLTQGGFYTEFVRITNPTTQEGAVFVTCYDDFGNQARVGLDALSDRDGDALPTELGAQASTDLIDIDDVWSACIAENPAIDPSAGGPGSPNGNFLRLRAEGEFGQTGPTTGQGEALGIRIEGLTVSRDADSFENISR